MKNSPKDLSSYTQTAIEAALLAGELLSKGFGSQLQISSKQGKHNLVTQYDTLCEKTIIEMLQKKYPSHSFLAEEGGERASHSKEFQWIIDPLDGTVNFAHGIPMFSVSIALRKEKEIFSGVVYHPLLKELFIAEKGKGAYLNGKKLSISSTEKLGDSFLSTGFPYNFETNPHHCIERLMDVLKTGTPIRRIGVASLDLAYVATGRFDGFFEASLAPWDCAAGILLIEEAGGKTTHWNGDHFDLYSYEPILSTNGHIHKELSIQLSRKIENGSD